MKSKFKVNDIAEQVTHDLKLYGEKVTEGIRIEGERCMKALVKQTKATAPVGKRKKHYRDSIKSKKIVTRLSSQYIWYVDGPDYRLSHLLEKGHALKDGGRVEGTHFIEKASTPIIEEYVKAVEEVIKNG